MKPLETVTVAYNVNNYIVLSYRFIIVVTSSVLKRNIKAKITVSIIKTHKTDEKSKNKFNWPTMDLLMNVILTIDNVHKATQRAVDCAPYGHYIFYVGLCTFIHAIVYSNFDNQCNLYI